jgi:hypothetical protein
MFRFNYHQQGAYYLSLLKLQHITRSLMMVIKPKHVGAVLM